MKLTGDGKVAIIVLSGRDKGRSGEVIEVRPSESRAAVRGIPWSSAISRIASQEGGIGPRHHSDWLRRARNREGWLITGASFPEAEACWCPVRHEGNAQIAPEEIRAGTVDKFQRQEAAACIVSMTGSSPEETPRRMEFLFSTNRINVAGGGGEGLRASLAPRDCARRNAGRWRRCDWSIRSVLCGNSGMN